MSQYLHSVRINRSKSYPVFGKYLFQYRGCNLVKGEAPNVCISRPTKVTRHTEIRCILRSILKCASQCGSVLKRGDGEMDHTWLVILYLLARA